MRFSTSRVAAAFVLVTPGLWGPPVAAQPVESPLVIRRATVIDGTGTYPRAATIVVRNGVLESLTDGPDPPPLRGDERQVDAMGRWVIPGLIDLHQHAVGVSAPPAAWLATGVTAARDPGAELERGRALRDRIEAGEIAGPRLFLGLLLDLDPGQTRSSVRARIAAEDTRGLDQVRVPGRGGNSVRPSA